MEIIRLVSTSWLILVLGISLLMGRQHKKANQKRQASLWLGLFSLGGLIVIYLVKNNYLPYPAVYLSVIFPLIGVVFFMLLGKFKFFCPNCNAPAGLSGFFLRDDNVCTRCLKKVPSSLDSIDWANWIPDEEASLVFIIKDGKILLIDKKTGLGKGLVNGPGGRLEKGETPLQSAVRECLEEVGLEPVEPVKHAELRFQFKNGYKLLGHVFISKDYRGVPVSTIEADPFWCPLDSVPYSNMWADDILWLPDVIKGEKRKGFFIFDHETMLDSQVLELD